MPYIYELLEQVSNLIKTSSTKIFNSKQFSLLAWLENEPYYLYTPEQLANKWDNLSLFYQAKHFCSFEINIEKSYKELEFEQWLTMQDFVNQDIDTLLNNWNTYQEN